MKRIIVTAFIIGAVFILLGSQRPTPEEASSSHIKKNADANEQPAPKPTPSLQVDDANGDQDQRRQIAATNGEESIRVISIPKIVARAEKDTYDHALVICTGLLVIVGAFQIIFLWRTVNAARDNAQAAKLNAQALINSERAWVMADLRWRDRKRIIGLNTQKSLVDLDLFCENDGKTPAWITEARVRLELVDSVPPEPIFDPRRDGDFLELRLIPMTVKGKQVFKVDCGCDGGWNSGKTKMIYGFVRYRDVFESNRESRFGYTFTPSDDLERITNSKYNENT